MGEFTAQNAIEPRWNPALKRVAIRRFLILAALLLAAAVVGFITVLSLGRSDHAITMLLAVVVPIVAAIGCVKVVFAIQYYQLIGKILYRLAFPIFLGAIVGMVLFTWAFALIFQTVDAIAAAQPPAEQAVAATSTSDTTCFVSCFVSSCFSNSLTTSQIAAHISPYFKCPVTGTWSRLNELVADALWIFQFRLVRDFILAFGALSIVSITASFAIWWERKVAGRIQSRLGPMRVGGWHGWAQSIADGLKLVQKEDICIAGADRPLFKLAPYFVFIPVLAAFIALPFASQWAFRDLDVAILFILSMVGIDVVGIIIGGWASNNKWSTYGAMRVACQMVSYEIPMGMALLIPVMTIGSLSLVQIGDSQAGGYQTWLIFANPFTFAAAIVYFISSLASVKRAPFDLPEAESELVAGFHTEYSGFRWAVFFFGEYAAMLVVSGLATILFLGAWYSPLPAEWGAPLLEKGLLGRAVYGILYAGPIWFIVKAYALIYVQIWLRWTLPRVRIDQVMYVCIQVLLPITLVLLLGNTLWQVFVPTSSMLAKVAHAALLIIGTAVVAMFVLTAAGGYINRRRKLGSLVVDHLPGA